MALSERIGAVIAETIDAGGEVPQVEAAIRAVLDPAPPKKRAPSKPVVYDLNVETGALSWRYVDEAPPEDSVKL